jgi:membrane protein required for colicin V production
MNNLPLNIVDIAFLSAILISGIIGFLRGFINETLSIISWIGAIFAVIYGLPLFKSYGQQMIENVFIADIATGGVIFLLILIILSIITKFISNTVQAGPLSNLDKSLGFSFGLIRTIVLFSFALIIWDWATPDNPRPAWLQSAKTLPIIKVGSHILINIVPDSLIDKTGINTATKDTITDVIGLKNTYETLTQPLPNNKFKDSDTDGSYEKKVRREMDRLFQTNQDN